MRTKICLYCTTLLIFAMPHVVCGQVEFVEGMNKEFLTRKPSIGEAIENVKVFDQDGNEFELNSTQGKHTVLIFGCLT